MIPRREVGIGDGVDLRHLLIERGDLLLPIGDDLVPLNFFVLRAQGQFGSLGLGDLLLERGRFAADFLMPGEALRLDIDQLRLQNAPDLFDDAGHLRLDLAAARLFEILLNIIRPAPLLVDFGTDPFVFILNPAADLGTAGGELRPGAHAGLHNLTRGHQGMGNGAGGGFGFAQADGVDNPDGGEEGADSCQDRIGQDLRSHEKEDRSSGHEGKNEENPERGVAEKSRQRKLLEIRQLSFCNREVVGHFQIQLGQGNIVRQVDRALAAEQEAERPVPAKGGPGALQQ